MSILEQKGIKSYAVIPHFPPMIKTWF